MAISVFDLFSIGIGPSSSHTVGPMRAARIFLQKVESKELKAAPSRVKVDLYGSLALTGHGHGTDMAVCMGLEGETPEGIIPDEVPAKMEKIRTLHSLYFGKKWEIPFVEKKDLLFHKDKQLPFHPNGMKMTAWDTNGEVILEDTYYSVGGGFVVEHAEAIHPAADKKEAVIPYPFSTGDELLLHGQKEGASIAELMRRNEKVFRSEEAIENGLLNIWSVMKGCIERGCQQEGILPGGLGVRRRAKKMRDELSSPEQKPSPLSAMEWVSLWALSVNEENAAGGRVVTAPTNGAAGVIPAVLKYYEHFIPEASSKGIVDFMLVAGAMGILFKKGASISAAEMGCMGEVGVACAMAAAGLTAAMGGTNEQIENAAEIGMEHNLGLTCDPIKGLVQIPCIERNTMGAVKAINASMLALRGDGTHRVSLDQVIATMRATGKDMKSIYKETSLGGLAVNVPEC